MENRVLINSLVLPMSPSANSYWRTRTVTPRNGKPFSSTYVSEEGVAYKKLISELFLVNHWRFNSTRRIRFEMIVCMRDRRRSDIDNRCKPAIDAVKEAGLFADDEQIDELIVRRGPIVKDGKIILCVTEITPDYDSLLGFLGGQS